MLVRALGRFQTTKMVAELAKLYQSEGDWAQPLKDGFGVVQVICPTVQVQAIARYLRDNGAKSVTVSQADYVFAAENALYDRLLCRLKS